MSTIILEKPEGDTSPVITDPCIAVGPPTQFMLLGGGNATITFNGVTVGSLSRREPLFVADVPGDYCVSISGQCPYTAVCTDLVFVAGGGGGGGSPDPQSDGTSDFYVDAAGDPIYVIKIYDEDTGVTTYTDTSGAPLVPGVDFFPSVDECCISYEQMVDIMEDGEEDRLCVPVLTSVSKGIATHFDMVSMSTIPEVAVVTPSEECCPVECGPDDGPAIPQFLSTQPPFATTDPFIYDILSFIPPGASGAAVDPLSLIFLPQVIYSLSPDNKVATILNINVDGDYETATINPDGTIGVTLTGLAFEQHVMLFSVADVDGCVSEGAFTLLEQF